MSGPPRLSDGRIVVRSLEEKDFDAYLAAFAEGDSLLNLLGYEQAPDVQAATRWLAHNWYDPPELEVWEFAIADAASDAFLGTIMFHSLHWKHRRAEIGAWIAEHARDRGAGSAAFRLVLDWAFVDLGLERIEITALPENENVPHIAKAFGFTFEGTMRQRNFERGRRVDLLLWSLLRDERTKGG